MCIYGKPEGAGTGVSLSNTQYPGLGVPVPFDPETGVCGAMVVRGLTPNESYVSRWKNVRGGVEGQRENRLMSPSAQSTRLDTAPKRPLRPVENRVFRGKGYHLSLGRRAASVNFAVYSRHLSNSCTRGRSPAIVRLYDSISVLFHIPHCGV